MSQVKKNAVNISAPNLIALCINGLEHGEMQGEFYHYYSEEPVVFASSLELIREMEKLFDELVFPQASTRARSFLEQSEEIICDPKRREKMIPWEELLSHSGTIGSFITCVKFRQRSSWQGDFYWKEQEEKIFFSSALEFLRLMNQKANQGQKED